MKLKKKLFKRNDIEAYFVNIGMFPSKMCQSVQWEKWGETKNLIGKFNFQHREQCGLSAGGKVNGCKHSSKD